MKHPADEFVFEPDDWAAEMTAGLRQAEKGLYRALSAPQRLLGAEGAVELDEDGWVNGKCHWPPEVPSK